MKMARLKSVDLQPLCKMPSPSSFFSGHFVSRHSFPRGQSIPRQTARRRLPFTNFRAKQPRSTDRELRSSSFPFAVPIALPIFRSVSSRSPYQFVVCWPSVRRRTGSPLGSSTDLHHVLFPISFRSPPSIRRQGRSPPSVKPLQLASSRIS